MTDLQTVQGLLKQSKTIAVLGAHTDPEKAAYYVPAYLKSQGYEIFPVNAQKTGETLFDKSVVSSLAELRTPIDIVDVFRRSEALPEHVEDILAMNPLPKVVWFQLGIQNDDVAKTLQNAGITVVQNRCTLADHKKLAGEI
jgi:uncharacterized protein